MLDPLGLLVLVTFWTFVIFSIFSYIVLISTGQKEHEIEDKTKAFKKHIAYVLAALSIRLYISLFSQEIPGFEGAFTRPVEAIGAISTGVFVFLFLRFFLLNKHLQAATGGSLFSYKATIRIINFYHTLLIITIVLALANNLITSNSKLEEPNETLALLAISGQVSSVDEILKNKDCDIDVYDYDIKQIPIVNLAYNKTISKNLFNKLITKAISNKDISLIKILMRHPKFDAEYIEPVMQIYKNKSGSVSGANDCWILGDILFNSHLSHKKLESILSTVDSQEVENIAYATNNISMRILLYGENDVSVSIPPIYNIELPYLCRKFDIINLFLEKHSHKTVDITQQCNGIIRSQ